MALVVDASVGLKWVLHQPGSDVARALLQSRTELLVPDFWLQEVTNVLWVQVRKKLFLPDEAQEALSILRTLLTPTPTARLHLHDVALGIGIAVDHAPYDTMYLAFALAMGAKAVVGSDGAFVRAIRRHSDPALAAVVRPLQDWASAAKQL